MLKVFFFLLIVTEKDFLRVKTKVGFITGDNWTLKNRSLLEVAVGVKRERETEKGRWQEGESDS